VNGKCVWSKAKVQTRPTFHHLNTPGNADVNQKNHLDWGVFTQRTNSLFVDFETDGTKSDYGWEIAYRSVKCAEGEQCDCTVNCGDEDKFKGKYEVACGWSKNADKPSCQNPGFKEQTELHEVRCCSDTSLNAGWKKHNNKCPYAESDVPQCFHDKTFTEAKEICRKEGARLCTAEELKNDCTIGTGCHHDSDLIWSSTKFQKPAWANYDTCPHTRCKFEEKDGHTNTKIFHGYAENGALWNANFHCERLDGYGQNNCKCVCDDSFKCSMTHHHASGTSTNYNACAEKQMGQRWPPASIKDSEI